MKRLTIVLTLLSLTAVSFAAPPRDDDFDFAQGLMDRKFYDLAREQFQRIISEAKTTEQKANGELGLALLLKAQAGEMQNESKREPAEVLDVFQQAEDKFDSFLKTYPNHPKKVDAQFEIGNLLRMKGAYLTRLVEEKADKAEEYRAAADKAFGTAIDLFQEVSTRLEGREDPEADWNRRKATYFHAVTHYDRGLLYPEGSSERRSLLEKSCDLLIDFIWDNEENILGGYAYFFYGLAKAKLNEPNEALEYMKTLGSNYGVPNREKDPATYEIWTELFMQTYYKLGEYCNQLGQQGDHDYREDAVEQFEKMIERIPDVWDRKTGHFALLEYAKALSGLNEFNKAIQICSKVSARGEELSATTDWGAATAFLANRLLPEIIADAAAVGIETTLDPDNGMRAAMGKKLSREWNQAVRAFQGVIRAVRGKDNETKYAPQAWMEIGECYYRAEKFREALIAYEHVADEWPNIPLAGDAAYYSYRAATALHAATKDPRDEELKKKKRGEFATKFKDHPRSIDLQYYEAADLISDADAKRLAGDTKGAAEIYRQALDQLAGVKPTSILYSKALARMGEVYFQLGEPQKALDQFQKVVDYVDNEKNVTTDEERIANREQAKALCAYYAARAHAKLENWTAVLADLKDYESTYADENVKNFHAPVKYERGRALIKLGRLDEAEKQTLELRDFNAEHPYTPYLFSLLAQKFQEAAMAAREGNATGSWKEYLRKAAEYYSWYLDRKDAPTWDDWRQIGLWYKDLEDWAKANTYLQRAIEMLSTEIEKFSARDPKRKELEDARDGLSILLSEMLMKDGNYMQAREVFERLLIPDPTAKERVFQLLQMQDFDEASLKELMSKIRAVPSLMEGLAKCYQKTGGGDRNLFLRALTLLRILIVSDPGNRYTEKWWGWQLLRVQTLFAYGEAFKDTAAFENVIKLVDDWNSLGVLKNAPAYEEFNTLRSRADLELKKLR